MKVKKMIIAAYAFIILTYDLKFGTPIFPKNVNNKFFKSIKNDNPAPWYRNLYAAIIKKGRRAHPFIPIAIDLEAKKMYDNYKNINGYIDNLTDIKNKLDVSQDVYVTMFRHVSPYFSKNEYGVIGWGDSKKIVYKCVDYRMRNVHDITINLNRCNNTGGQAYIDDEYFRAYRYSTEDEINEFNRRASLAEGLNIALNYHQKEKERLYLEIGELGTEY